MLSSHFMQGAPEGGPGRILKQLTTSLHCLRLLRCLSQPSPLRPRTAASSGAGLLPRTAAAIAAGGWARRQAAGGGSCCLEQPQQGPPPVRLRGSTASPAATGRQQFAAGAGTPAAPPAAGVPRLRQLARRESCRRGSLRAMKRLHEPVVVLLAGMEQEWPEIGQARMGLMKYAEICNHMPKYAIISRYMDYMQFCIFICRNLQENMQRYVSNMPLLAVSRQKYAKI